MTGEEENKCKFESDRQWACHREREPDSEFCICHLEKEDKDPEKFWTEIDKILNDKDAQEFDFTGFFFIPRTSWKEYEINFRYFVFSKPVIFWDVTFLEDVDFRKTTFSDDADFSGATFSGNGIFSDATFSGNGIFSDATFSGDGVFGTVTFLRNAEFSGATFSVGAEFLRAKFFRDANFWSTTFSGNAHYAGSTFSGNVELWGATFSGDADFSFSTFSENAYFIRCVFIKKGNFNDVTFSGDIRFRNTAFKSAEFDDAIFSEGADFFSTKFRDNVSFRRVAFDMPEKVKFHKTDLTHASFLYTDIRKLNFLDPEWQIKEMYVKDIEISIFKYWERNTLYDEVGSTDYSAIESLYRQLKSNYEENRNYPEAGDFYIGEIEMRRRNPNTRKTERLIYDFYKVIGLYGESIRIPLSLFVVLILFSTSGFYVLGDCNVTGLNSFKTALTFAYLRPNLELVTSFKELLLGLFTSVAGVILIALTVIAMKRRVRR